VQVIADPAGRLIWVSPTLPGSRHDIGAAREHGILDAFDTALARRSNQISAAPPVMPQPKRIVGELTVRWLHPLMKPSHGLGSRWVGLA
jgi:hypothetical protein